MAMITVLPDWFWQVLFELMLCGMCVHVKQNLRKS